MKKVIFRSRPTLKLRKELLQEENLIVAFVYSICELKLKQGHWYSDVGKIWLAGCQAISLNSTREALTRLDSLGLIGFDQEKEIVELEIVNYDSSALDGFFKKISESE